MGGRQQDLDDGKGVWSATRERTEALAPESARNFFMQVTQRDPTFDRHARTATHPWTAREHHRIYFYRKLAQYFDRHDFDRHVKR
jgi:hypothetical protein